MERNHIKMLSRNKGSTKRQEVRSFLRGHTITKRIKVLQMRSWGHINRRNILETAHNPNLNELKIGRTLQDTIEYSGLSEATGKGGQHRRINSKQKQEDCYHWRNYRALQQKNQTEKRQNDIQ